MLRRNIPVFARQLRSFASRTGGSGRRVGAVSFAAAAAAASLGASVSWADAAKPAAPSPQEAKKELAKAASSPSAANGGGEENAREPASAVPAAEAAPKSTPTVAQAEKDDNEKGGVEVKAKQEDPEALADISNLQVYDRNWDGRAPKEGEARPKASRYIVLVRHGHYLDDKKTDEERVLTSTGRQQARVLAGRLAEMPWKASKVIVSDMKRAQETFDIVMEKMPEGTPTQVLPSLREGRPCQPIPASRRGLYKQALIDKDRARIDEAWREIFHRASPEQEKSSHEVVVCHANVIRYFVCKALQVPTEAWLRMGLAHCSYTVIEIKPSGLVIVRGVGDTHNLPPHLVTFS